MIVAVAMEAVYLSDLPKTVSRVRAQGPETTVDASDVQAPVNLRLLYLNLVGGVLVAVCSLQPARNAVVLVVSL